MLIACIANCSISSLPPLPENDVVFGAERERRSVMSRRAQPRGARARSPRSGRVRVVERHATGTGQIAATPVCPNLFVALEAPTPPTRRTARAFADAARARPWPHPVATWAAPFRFPLRASRAPGSSAVLVARTRLPGPRLPPGRERAPRYGAAQGRPAGSAPKSHHHAQNPCSSLPFPLRRNVLLSHGHVA